MDSIVSATVIYIKSGSTYMQLNRPAMLLYHYLHVLHSKDMYMYMQFHYHTRTKKIVQVVYMYVEDDSFSYFIL